MGKKVVNIDDILADNVLELHIKNKVFTVKDFDLAEFLRLMNSPESEDPMVQQKIVQEQLANAFEVDVSELNGFGLKTLMVLVTQIRDWIVGDAEEVAGSDTENP